MIENGQTFYEDFSTPQALESSVQSFRMVQENLGLIKGFKKQMKLEDRYKTEICKQWDSEAEC